MEEGDKHPKCQLSIVVSGPVPDAENPLLSPWPKMAAFVVEDDDDAVEIGYEQHHPPQELYLLPDEVQTPAAIQDIVLKSLKTSADEAVPEPEVPQTSEELPTDSHVEEISESSGVLQVSPVDSSSDSSHSRSTSTTSSSLSTSPSTNDGAEGSRSGSRKSTLFAFLPSKTDIIGPMKQAMKEPSSIVKRAMVQGPHGAARSSKSECASCLEHLPSRKMYKLKCKHSYCRECFTTLITTAMHTESMFPPRCCLKEVPLKDILSTLDKAQKELYKCKAAEYTLKPGDRWYCPNLNCQRWIPPSKLHRLRVVGAKCPSCDTRICGHCRGVEHLAGADCPQDSGLEATLEEAERQGWRRCHKCRALVELTSGCRHITCKCGAQFCYTCGAKWCTCSCREIDQLRRHREIAERRAAQTSISRQEEEDIARVISAIEELERREAEQQRREAIERQRKENNQRTSENAERRRRQHLERLEGEKRRLEEEEATRRREQAICRCIIKRYDYLRSALLEIQRFQQTSLISRHSSEIATLVKEVDNGVAVQNAQSDSLHIKLDSNSTLRRSLLQSAHNAAVSKMTSKHEAEVDDTFLLMQTYLRGKPHQESRTKAVLDTLRQRQKVEMDRLVRSQEAETKRLAENVAAEHQTLDSGHDIQPATHNQRFKERSTALKKTMLAERKWFEVIAERRRAMMRELQRELWAHSGLDPLLAASTRAVVLGQHAVLRWSAERVATRTRTRTGTGTRRGTF